MFTIPSPEALLRGYKLSKTDTHERVAEFFLNHPDRSYRMIQVAKFFPEMNAETIRTHIRKLHAQAFLRKSGDLEYALNPAYRSPAQKREEVVEHIRSGQSRLQVVEAAKSLGPYAPTNGTAVEVKAKPKETTTISTAAEMLKRHLTSLRERMGTNPAFTKADIEMLEELEVMAGL